MKNIERGKILEILGEMRNDDLLALHNEIFTYDTIYDMDDFDEICSGMTPSEIAQKIFYGDFRPCDKYFTFNGYENLKSNDYLDELISLDDIADAIISEECAYYNDDIQEHFDDLEEDEEE